MPRELPRRIAPVNRPANTHFTQIVSLPRRLWALSVLLPLSLAACVSTSGGVSSASSTASPGAAGATPASAVAAPATSAALAATLPSPEIPYTRFTLANGLTVIVHEDHSSPVVAVNVWYHVGSKDEPTGRHGFAHLFEHLMFNGSQHYDDEFFRALEPAGATDMNGTTNTDRTNYYETVPTAALDRALWLESDRMGYLTGAINQAKLDEQRGVVLNEKRQDENQPYGKVEDLIARETYPQGHPYSWTTIGSETDLNAASLADVKRWFQTYYGPNNATLAIAGDVDPADIKARVERYFGALPAGPAVPHVQSWTAPMSGDKHLSIQDDVPLPRVYLVWNVPGDGVHDNVRLDMAAQLLGGSADSRLYRRLVRDQQLASSVSASVDTNEIGGQLVIVATAKPGAEGVTAMNDEIKAIVAAINDEVARFEREGPSAAELEAVRSANYAGYIKSIEKVSGKAALLVANQVFHDDPGEFLQEFKWQSQLTPTELREAAQQWLSLGHLQLDVLPQPKLHNSAQDVSRAALPELAAPAPLKLPPLQKATLSNGLKVVFAERHNVPVVDVQMMFDVGRAADARDSSGLAAATVGMLDDGAGQYDALTIERMKKELGASLGGSTGRDVSVVSLSALKPKLVPSLDLYATVIRQPTFPEQELARAKRQLLAAIVQEKASPSGMARRVLSGLLFGENHAYAYQGSGNEKFIKSLTTDQLRSFYQQWIRPDNATLLVVGDTTLSEIQPLLEARFGDWHAPAQPLAVKHIETVALPSKPRVYLMDKPGAEQSLVMFANLAPPTRDADDEAMQIVNDVIGGEFVSRLNLNLREDKHWSYGAHSSLADARGQQPFLAYSEVEWAHTADAMREMDHELRNVVGAKPPTGAEIEAARQSELLALPAEFQTTPEIASGFSHLLEFGLPDDYWTTMVPRMEALTPAQIAQAAQRMIKPDAATWLVIGDLKRVQANVRKLGLGEVQVIDADGHVLQP